MSKDEESCSDAVDVLAGLYEFFFIRWGVFLLFAISFIAGIILAAEVAGSKYFAFIIVPSIFVIGFLFRRIIIFAVASAYPRFEKAVQSYRKYGDEPDYSDPPFPGL